MEELVRCPACRGTKKVAKLGGVIGDCNTCNGEGKIKSCDKPVPKVADTDTTNVNDIKLAVSRVMPNQIDPLESVESKELDFNQAPDDIKIIYDIPDKIADIKEIPVINKVGKRAIYKRKQS